MSFVIDVVRIAGECLRRMLSRWYLVLLSLIVAVAIAGYQISRSSPVYTSTMIVVEADRSRPSLAGALSNAAGSNLVGLALGGGAASGLADYLQLLQSATVAQALITKHQYDRVLLAGQIDPATGKWLPTRARRISQFFYDMIGVTMPDTPTLGDVRGIIDGMLVFNPAANQTVVTITCNSSRQTLCPELMLLVHQEAEAQLNKMSLDQARNMSSYFERILPTINQIEIRLAITQILADVQKQIATAVLGQPNAAVILDPPIVPPLPSAPQPRVLLALAIYAGIAIGGVLAWTAYETKWDRHLFWFFLGGRSRARSV